MKNNQIEISGRGYEENYKIKDKRSLALSELQLIPYFIKKGETISVNVSGRDNDKLYLCTGLPQVNKQHKYAIFEGTNTYTANDDGILSFINNNDEGSKVVIELISQHQKIPFFSLGKNSNADFKKEINEYSAAPYVLLMSNFADIVVTYNSAKKYIDNAEKLMTELDVAIGAENDVGGLIKCGEMDFKLSPNRCLHIESDVLYMYATNGHLGFTGSAALELLLSSSGDKWGIWHENGHQRQQTPWTWDGGTGGVETTVNIYSLSAEEKILGKVKRLDPYYDKMRQFLAKKEEDKNYDEQELYVKVCMFWQLKQTFGDAFYPQIHQLYRTMSNNVTSSQDKKQLFIQNTSKIAKVNLMPFFEKWGILSDINNIVALSNLPELTLPIWENDNNHVHKIPLPEGKYIPELLYLKKCVNNILLENKTIKFSIDLEWYDKYQFMFFVNDQYIAEIADGKPYYCHLNVDDDGAQVTYYFNENTDLKELLGSDVFNIRVNLKDNHIIYKSTALINSLMQSVRELYVDDELSIIKDDVSQSLLDELWDKYNNLDETEITEKILDKLREVQRSVLANTIKKHTIVDKNSSVIFKDESYKHYEYVTVMNGDEVAKLQYGNALPPSTVNNNTWSTPIPVISPEYIYIYVDVKGFRYAIKKTYIKEIDILDKINALYSDIEQEILIESLTQSDIDLCNDNVWNSGLPYWKKDVLERKVDKVQSLFIKNTITSTYIINNIYVVEFNEKHNFIDYRYFLYSSKGYISEISYGKAYYSSLNGLRWETAINNTIKPESIYIEAYHNKWLTIHTESDSAKWIKAQLK